MEGFIRSMSNAELVCALGIIASSPEDPALEELRIAVTNELDRRHYYV